MIVTTAPSATKPASVPIGPKRLPSTSPNGLLSTKTSTQAKKIAGRRTIAG